MADVPLFTDSDNGGDVQTMERVPYVEEEAEFSDEPLASGVEKVYYVGDTGEGRYTSFQAALEAVAGLTGDDNTVKIVLEKDAEFNSDYTINSGVSLEIDLNDKVLTIKDGRFVNSTKLKIHNGKMHLFSNASKGFSVDGNGETVLDSVTADGKGGALIIGSESEVELKNSTITGMGGEDKYAVYNKGTLTIVEGTKITDRPGNECFGIDNSGILTLKNGAEINTAGLGINNHGGDEPSPKVSIEDASTVVKSRGFDAIDTSAGTVTIENGIIESEGQYAINQSGGEVKIKDGIIKAEKDCAVCVEYGNLPRNLLISGGNVTTNGDGCATVAINPGAIVAIEGGNFVSNTVMALSNNGDTTLNGGVYTTKGTGSGVIHAASGTLTINGGFFGGSQYAISNPIYGEGSVVYPQGMRLSDETVLRSDSGSEYPYKWVGKPIKLTYALDGGSGQFPEQSFFSHYTKDTTGPATDSISTTISTDIPTRNGYCFAGWTADGKTYAPGETIQISKDTTLTAMWARIDLRYADGSKEVTPYGTGLEIEAIASGGSLSGYKWYRNDTDSNQGGTLVSDSGADSLTIPSTTPVGTKYYYCTAEVTLKNSNKLTAVSQPIKVVIQPNALDINTPQAVSRAYDGTDVVEISQNGLSGKVPGEDVSLPGKITGTIENPNAGTNKTVTVGKIQLTGTDKGNYTVSLPQNLKVNITPATLGTDALKLEDKSFPYGSQPALTPVLNGVNNEKVAAEYEYTWYTDKQLTSLYGSDGKTAPASSGTYYVKAECTSVTNPNYQLPNTSLSASAKITIMNQYIPQPSPSPEIPENYPEGTVKNPDGSYTTPDNVVIKPDQGIILPDGTELVADHQGNKPSIDKEGTVTDTNGTAIKKDGAVILPGEDTSSVEDDTTVSQGTGTEKPAYNPKDGTVITKKGNEVTLPGGIKVLPKEGSVVQKDGTVTEPDGTVISPDGTVTEPDGTVISPDGTVTKPDGTVTTPDGMVHNPDGSVQNQKGEYVRPAKMVIEERTVKGNTLSINLEKKAAGAEGYDYIISQNPNCIKEKDYLLVNKNTLLPSTSFRYLQKGTYYVAGHAWTYGEDGKKVFGPWSELIKIEVTSITPSAPKILKVQVKGSTVRVIYTRSSHAAGYDLVLGAAARKVNGELRPVEYGRLVRKITKGNIVTAVFKNVPKGTYYLGLHAFNRTSEDLKKVFSPWSGARKVMVR